MPKDLLLKLETFGWLWAFQFGLRFLSFRRVSSWQRRLVVRQRTELDEEAALEFVRRLRAAIRRSTTRVRNARCLAEALAGQVVLARNGVASELKIGVRQENGKLDAHAWLERHGRCVLGEGELDDFTQFEGLDALR